MFLWIAFIFFTSVIVYSGTKLSKYGDIIAEKTGLGRTWIGVVLMASITSLPELVTGISSVTYAGVPDIAVGDVLGSCVFNILIIAFLDAIYSEMPLSTKAHYGHVLAGSFGILLLSITTLSLFLGDRMWSTGWVGLYSFLFIFIYLVAIRLVYSYEKRQLASYLKESVLEYRYKHISTRSAVLNYVVNAMVVIGTAIFLPKIGKGIAETTGLGQTFVGNIFIATSTSLPEVVVSISAVKIDAVDLAIGNLFGSNIFNIFILAIDDILFLKSPLFSYADQGHIVSAMSAIVMTAIAIAGLTYRAQKKRIFLAWDSLGIVITYIMNLVLLYNIRH